VVVSVLVLVLLLVLLLVSVVSVPVVVVVEFDAVDAASAPVSQHPTQGSPIVGKSSPLVPHPNNVDIHSK
jgi:hypothetical protein